jgi:hypothetical protein
MKHRVVEVEALPLHPNDRWHVTADISVHQGGFFSFLLSISLVFSYYP